MVNKGNYMLTTLFKIKNIQGNRTPNYDIYTRKKGRNIKIRQMLVVNETKVL